MPKGFKADKPINNLINPNTIQADVIACMEEQVNILGYDLRNPKDRKHITHNEVNYILRRIYDNIFKPSKGLMNNQKSIIDYDDVNQIQAVVNVFIDICSRLNKSLGLMSFSFMTGIDITTLLRWLNDRESNPKRYEELKRIQEVHKALQIGLLNDSPVGALAVANNDVETGLQWGLNQAQAVTSNTIYILPTERGERLEIAGKAPTPVELPG